MFPKVLYFGADNMQSWCVFMVKSENKKALSIGLICVSTYLVNYYSRNLLGVMTPTLTEAGFFTNEFAGLLSSVYMLFYAGGQLINGILGDRLSPKRMVLIGIATASLATIAFPFIVIPAIQLIFFALLGFGLSMVRGPLMKIILENTTPNKARTICVFFSFASFAGPLVASLFAMISNWIWTYLVAGLFALAIAILSYVFLTIMERKKMISYRSTKGEGIRSITSVFKIEKFGFFMVIACLVEIAGASISFWIPTYLVDVLHFEKGTANLIYTGISICRAFMPFVALTIFRLIKERDILMMRFTLSIAGVMFLAMIFTTSPYLSIAFLLLALMAMSCTSALLWSIYIPGLGKTGKVSSVNGILDCTGYIAAAIANVLFATAMTNIGWSAVFVLWASLGAIGLIATFFVKTKKA